MQEPRTEEEFYILWNILPEMPSFINKGPLCKLMRWFSFNEFAKYYHSCPETAADVTGQLWVTKMVLEHHFQIACDEEAEPKVVLPTHDAKTLEEIRKLKAQTGQLRLAPQLITAENLWVLDLIIEVSAPSWFAYGDKAKNVKSPSNAIEDAIHEKQGNWQAELVSLVANCLNGANGRKSFTKLELLNCNYEVAEQRTAKLVDVVLLIIHHRARSATSLTSLFPHRQSLLQAYTFIITINH